RSEYLAYGTYWEEAAYAGILALMFAVAALSAWWRRREEPSQGPLALVPFFALLSFLSLVLALGVNTPLYPLLFRYVPGFGLFQAPARLMIGYALGIALLAGAGADSLRLTPRTRTMLRVATVTGCGIAIAGIAARLAMPGVRASFGDSMVRLGVMLALASGVLLLRGKRLRGRGWEAIVIILVAADLLAFGWGLAPGTNPAVFRDPVATAEFLQTQPPGRILVAEPYAGETYDQYLSLSAFGPTDPVYLQDLRESLMPNLSTIHHLPGVDNYDPLTVGLYRDLYDILKGDQDTTPDLEEIQPVLNLFGARYLVTDDERSLPLLYDAGPRIYGNDTALPAAYIVHQARVIKDEQVRLDALLDPAFDPRTEVILSHAPPINQPPSVADATEEKPSVLREGPDRVTLEVGMTQPGFLVLADTYYPGWQATVNGEAVEIMPANHAFRAVQLGEGEQTVVFEYTPLSFRVGSQISAAAALLLGTALVLSRLRKKLP
ncbi:MAG TPA: YfhO family protein, partial [Anaerolineae bacterium]|nr:YfhO family protein [Anaerolineae bacterium]